MRLRASAAPTAAVAAIAPPEADSAAPTTIAEIVAASKAVRSTRRALVTTLSSTCARVRVRMTFVASAPPPAIDTPASPTAIATDTAADTALSDDTVTASITSPPTVVTTGDGRVVDVGVEDAR